MIRDTTTRNHAAWLSVADFLTRQNIELLLAAHASAHEKRSAGADEGAGLSTLPDGNHGEITEAYQA